MFVNLCKVLQSKVRGHAHSAQNYACTRLINEIPLILLKKKNRFDQPDDSSIGFLDVASHFVWFKKNILFLAHFLQNPTDLMKLAILKVLETDFDALPICYTQKSRPNKWNRSTLSLVDKSCQATKYTFCLLHLCDRPRKLCSGRLCDCSICTGCPLLSVQQLPGGQTAGLYTAAKTAFKNSGLAGLLWIDHLAGSYSWAILIPRIVRDTVAAWHCNISVFHINYYRLC